MLYNVDYKAYPANSLPSNRKWFYEKENALKYIAENKVLFSWKDVERFCIQYGYLIVEKNSENKVVNKVISTFKTLALDRVREMFK